MSCTHFFYSVYALCSKYLVFSIWETKEKQTRLYQFHNFFLPIFFSMTFEKDAQLV